MYECSRGMQGFTCVQGLYTLKSHVWATRHRYSSLYHSSRRHRSLAFISRNFTYSRHALPQASKAPIQNFADYVSGNVVLIAVAMDAVPLQQQNLLFLVLRFCSGIFVPVVISLAVLTFAIWLSFSLTIMPEDYLLPGPSVRRDYTILKSGVFFRTYIIFPYTYLI